MSQTIIYSHGFGVRKDDRGLFTGIAAHFPEFKHVMFDYNEINEADNTLTASPLDTQAAKLLSVIAHERESDDNVITLICHSQGCVSAALAAPDNLAKIIFLAPPAKLLGLEKKELYKLRPGTTTTEDGTILYPRRDGSITIIKDDYWKSRVGVEPIALYNKLARNTELTIVKALEDEVLTNSDFSGLSDKIELMPMHANHDFTSAARPELLRLLGELL